MSPQIEAVALLPCPFCGGDASADGHIRYSRPLTDAWWPGDVPITEAFYVNCIRCGAVSRSGIVGGYPTKAEAIERWNTRLSTPVSAENGWIVGRGDGKRWATWESGMPEWTEDRDKATRYARREDAESVHREDEDAWTVVPFAAPIHADAAPSQEGVVEVLQDFVGALTANGRNRPQQLTINSHALHELIARANRALSTPEAQS